MYVVYSIDAAKISDYIDGLGNCFHPIAFFDDRQEAIAYTQIVEGRGGRLVECVYHPEQDLPKPGYVGEVVRERGEIHDSVGQREEDPEHRYGVIGLPEEGPGSDGDLTFLGFISAEALQGYARLLDEGIFSWLALTEVYDLDVSE